jgi:orotidine-5'-phosphate decarboxylase
VDIDVSAIPIVALDVPSAEAALAIVDELEGDCGFFKIGSELFTACGPSVVRDVRGRRVEVFLDLKFHDIPNTVAGAVRSAAALGVRLLTVHCAGGSAMIHAATTAAGDSHRCAVFAVTLLTSLSADDATAVWGRESEVRVADEVVRLAGIAREGGAAGVVCGGREARLVKERFGASLSVLIPGIRLPGGETHDQSRTSTAAEAAAAGADYVVIGRAVTAAADRRSAMREIREQLG